MSTVGIDFDNTIVCYETLFHRVASEQELIPSSLEKTKLAVRAHLRATNRESEWTALQGIVYGERMQEAEAFPGIKRAIARLLQRHERVVIISHKTRYALSGGTQDLHAAALSWLQREGFFSDLGLRREDVFFEPTKEAKLHRIAEEHCVAFIDDLPEILDHEYFPEFTTALLFSPNQPKTTDSERTIHAWNDIVTDGFPALGLAPVLKTESLNIRKLDGGANNRVCVFSDGDKPLVVRKSYYHGADDGRNRFASERAFYRYLSQTEAAPLIPRVEAWDPEAKTADFEFVSGEKPKDCERFREAALNFLVSANRGGINPALSLPPASEHHASHLSPINAVETRLRRLLQAVPADEVAQEASELIRHVISHEWASVKEDYLRELQRLYIEPSAKPDEIFASPSDFGPHNALVREDGEIRFLDFEYAGWDDAAKLSVDFIMQPNASRHEGDLQRFSAELARALQFQSPDLFTARCLALAPLFRIKWTLIMLNEFGSSDAARRDFALGAEGLRSRRISQLQKVRGYLQVIA